MDTIRRFDPKAQVNIVSDDRIQVKVSKDAAPRLIGRGGSTISELEEMLGVKIDVEVKTPTLGREVEFEISEAGSSVTVLLGDETIGKSVDVYIEDEFLFSNQVGKKARIKVDKRSENGRRIINAYLAGQQIRVFLSRQ
jgi:ATPase